eukprot:CAMPEP_0118898664 /NCGR_PEP_ID=MMETSP1166-20130328/5556_1 /TAXON_ID=1104430 /ORGANISM="Chrysoreinhardia sp, Strain CCMP3193" /LENGTH=61 /DNA_ID=CAMNT_0006837775 /DNA_START=423 /DNA_END=604 /DNA_ORIENTATION=-
MRRDLICRGRSRALATLATWWAARRWTSSHRWFSLSVATASSRRASCDARFRPDADAADVA